MVVLNTSYDSGPTVKFPYGILAHGLAPHPLQLPPATWRPGISFNPAPSFAARLSPQHLPSFKHGGGRGSAALGQRWAGGRAH